MRRFDIDVDYSEDSCGRYYYTKETADSPDGPYCSADDGLGLESALNSLGYEYAGLDVNGYAWLWDVEHQKLFVVGDDGSPEDRGYHCPSKEEAIRRVEAGEVP